jgi:hypothetical protein
MSNRKIRLALLLFGLIWLTASISTAQNSLTDCPEIVNEALTSVGEACINLGRNEVCYGNNQVFAFDGEANQIADFALAGDVKSVLDVGSLMTTPLDTENNLWGVAVLSLRANIPDSLPGQNVTFLMFGDSSITADPDAAGDDLTAPLQAFRISTGIGVPECKEAPRDGILVQSPGGVKVNFRVNGLDIEMGSTVLLDVRLDEKVWVSTLEGEAKVTSEGVTEVAPPGYKIVTIPGNVPGKPEPYTYDEVAAMPVSLFENEVVIPFIVPAKTATNTWLVSGFALEAGKTYTVERTIFDREGVLTGTLVARIGEAGELFGVDETMEFTAESDGLLEFSIESETEASGGLEAFIVVVDEAAEEVE